MTILSFPFLSYHFEQAQSNTLETFQNRQEQINSPSNLNASHISETVSFSSENENKYQKYVWDIELSLVKYNIEYVNYELRSSTIPNSSGSTSPMIGAFFDGKLMAYHGILYTRFGDVYYQYYDFEEYVYLYIIYEKPNAEKYLTEEYLSQNEYTCEKSKKRIYFKKGYSFLVGPQK